MATHSSILARRIPWTEEPDGVQSMRSQIVIWLRVWTHKVCITFNFIRCCQIVFQSDWTSSPAVGEFQLLHIFTNTESESEVSQSWPTLRPRGLKPTRLLRPWDSPGKNTGAGCYFLASLVAQRLTCLPAMQETWVRFLGGEDLLEKGMVTNSSFLAWRMPRTEEPSRLQSMGDENGMEGRKCSSLT